MRLLYQAIELDPSYAAASIWTILPAQKKDLPFDVNRDFAQIGMIVASGPMYIAVSPTLGVDSFSGLIALARAKPREIVFGTNGAIYVAANLGLADLLHSRVCTIEELLLLHLLTARLWHQPAVVECPLRRRLL